MTGSLQIWRNISFFAIDCPFGQFLWPNECNNDYTHCRERFSSKVWFLELHKIVILEISLQPYMAELVKKNVEPICDFLGS